jgi:anti-sigma factor RsiW
MPDDRNDIQPPGGDKLDLAAGGARSRHLDLDALSAVIDGALPPADDAAARAHLATCPDCRQDLAELRATVDLLANLPLYEPRRALTLGPEHARGRPARRVDHPLAAGPSPALAPTLTLPSSRPAASTMAGAEVAGERGWGNRLLPNIRALQIATTVVAALFVLVTVGDLLAPAPESAPAAAPAGFVAAPAPALDAANDVAPAVVTLAPAEAVLEQQRDAVGGAAAGTDAVSDASVGADGTRARATEPERIRTSPWRVAQLALGLVLLWLVVSLAGRLIIDRHERMPG